MARRCGAADWAALTSGLAFESRLGGGTSSQMGRRGLAGLAMFVGALIGAVTELDRSKPLGLLIATALLVVVAVSAAHLSRNGPAWDRPD